MTKQSDILTRADVVILGAGVMGASIAYQISKQSDKRVVIVDQFAPVGGMSGRSFGQVRLHYSNALLLNMAAHGYQYFNNWREKVGCGSSGYHQMGYLLIVVENQLEALMRNIALADSIGINTQFVDPAEIRKIEPALNTDGLVGGIFDPAGGYIDVHRIVMSFLLAAQEHGAKLMTALRAKSIKTKGNTVSGVVTDQGTIETNVVVSATGGWSTDLLSSLDIDVPIEPRRLDTMYLRQPPGGAQIGCCITDGNSNVVVRPDMGRDILAAAYPPEMPLASDPGESSNAQADSDHLARIEKSLSERLPGFTDAKPVRSVSGTYDISPDWHPILGWLPNVGGLYLAAGFSGHGLKLAPAVGEVVCAAVLDSRPPFDVSPLRFERFAENDLMYLAYGPGGRA